MAKYKVHATCTTHSAIILDAQSQDEAHDIAEHTDGGAFMDAEEDEGSWNITDVELITDNAKILISDIAWDVDDSDDLDDLPSEVIIDSPSEDMLTELKEGGLDGACDLISDYLSDQYGFCHNGFTVDLLYN